MELKHGDIITSDCEYIGKDGKWIPVDEYLVGLKFDKVHNTEWRIRKRRICTPTEFGKKKYPDTEGYYEEFPCICTEKCDAACKGLDCGCKACSAAYGDFLSVE